MLMVIVNMAKAVLANMFEGIRKMDVVTMVWDKAMQARCLIGCVE